MYPYGDAHAAWYDALYAEALGRDTEQEAGDLLALVRAQLGRSPSSWLDVGCGTGRHLSVVTSEVDEVVGVDISEAMLDVARARLPGTVELRVGDQRTLDLGRTFDVVTSLFSSIGYVEDAAEARRTVARLADHTAAGGVLLVEPWVDPTDWDDDRAPQVIEATDGNRCAVRVTAVSRHGDVSHLDLVLVTAGDGRVDVQREDHRLVLVPHADLEAAARDAGLDVTWQEGPSGRGLMIGRRP